MKNGSKTQMASGTQMAPSTDLVGGLANGVFIFLLGATAKVPSRLIPSYSEAHLIFPRLIEKRLK
jgi:hypothetical protein